MKPTQLILPFGQKTKIVKVTGRKTSAKITVSELKSHGIASPSTLSAEVILELGRRYDNEAHIKLGTMHSPADVYNTFKVEMAGIPATTYNLIAVNVKHMITVTKLFSSLPTIEKVMRWAVVNSAAAIFVCRNSQGTPAITSDESNFIQELAIAGQVVGIDLLDFIVIEKHSFESARTVGLF